MHCLSDLTFALPTYGWDSHFVIRRKILVTISSVTDTCCEFVITLGFCSQYNIVIN